MTVGRRYSTSSTWPAVRALCLFFCLVKATCCASEVVNRHNCSCKTDAARKERKQAVKHDPAYRLACTLHEKGSQGVDAEFETTDAFHDAWKSKARDLLARAEFRRNKLTKRLKVLSEFDRSTNQLHSHSFFMDARQCTL
jgi:hypothetical protein